MHTHSLSLSHTHIHTPTKSLSNLPFLSQSPQAPSISFRYHVDNILTETESSQNLYVGPEIPQSVYRAKIRGDSNFISSFRDVPAPMLPRPHKPVERDETGEEMSIFIIFFLFLLLLILMIIFIFSSFFSNFYFFIFIYFRFLNFFFLIYFHLFFPLFRRSNRLEKNFKIVNRSNKNRKYQCTEYSTREITEY